MVLIAGLAAVLILQEAEYLRINSPDGHYTAIVTYPGGLKFQSSFPGQSGDKAGFIRIEDREGINYGKIGVPMVSMARDLKWTEKGAELTLVGEWNFARREYRFWNESQNEQILEQAR
jgi:hypothetical protein